jgi:hypothetical protein
MRSPVPSSWLRHATTSHPLAGASRGRVTLAPGPPARLLPYVIDTCPTGSRSSC